MRTSSFRWWFLLVVALLIVFLWPAGDSKSLALKFVNWAVDPWDELPILPPPLPLRAGDDPQAVEFHDIQTQQYDAVYQRGGWPRMRLTLKVADDPRSVDRAADAHCAGGGRGVSRMALEQAKRVNDARLAETAGRPVFTLR
jgi:hypothetical protein